jgi:large subunit ribosomal protein L22
MRLIIDLIRGKSVPEALHILHFSPKHASKVAEKVLRSAVSNLQNKDEGGRLDPDEIVVKRASVDGGMTMKRISPAPMGRAFRIRKRSNHVTIVVAAKDKKEKKDAKQARQVKKAGKPAKESKAGKSGAKQKSAADTK